jgi:hypothetical protein
MDTILASLAALPGVMPTHVPCESQDAERLKTSIDQAVRERKDLLAEIVSLSRLDGDLTRLG